MHEVARGVLDLAERRGGAAAVEVEPLSRTRGLSYEGCLGVVTPLWGDHLRTVSKGKFPIINISNSAGPQKGCGNVLSDDPAVGKMAADYLRGRGYRYFMVIMQEQGTVHRERAEAFESELGAAGLPVKRFAHHFQSRRAGGWSRTQFQEEIAEVLVPAFEGMEMSTGIFATTDLLANLVLKVLDSRFPEHRSTVGVLGVDNQQTGWYPGRLPGLSSIVPGFHEMGRRAMEWLFQHPGKSGCGEVAESLNVRVPPLRVVSRASTACGGCADPLTARMIRWAWERVQRGEAMSVAEMARAHSMSVKTLERKFGEHAGTTAVGLVAGLKLDLARHLLKETETPITEISERCGFSKHDVLSRALLKAEGCSPREFRQRHR